MTEGKAIHLQRYPSVCSMSNWQHLQTQERKEHFCCFMAFDYSQNHPVRYFHGTPTLQSGTNRKERAEQEADGRGARKSSFPCSLRGAVGQHWNLRAMTGKRWQHFAPKHEIKYLLLHRFHCILALRQWQGLWMLAGFILWALLLQYSVSPNWNSSLLW